MPIADDFAATRLKPLAPGIFLAFLGFTLGFGLGAVFGANEDAIKGKLKADADAVLATAYAGDAAKAKAVVDKSWVYMQRAHLHAGVLGACALSLILLLALLEPPGWPARLAALALGFGALAYGAYWMLAGFKAPGLGSTGAAKESLEWVAIPGSGAVILGFLATVVLTVKALYFKRAA